MQDFMKTMAEVTLHDVRKLGKETKEEQDKQDAHLRVISYRLADRYLSRFGGSLSGWYGKDNHWRVRNRYGMIIAKVID